MLQVTFFLSVLLVATKILLQELPLYVLEVHLLSLINYNRCTFLVVLLAFVGTLTRFQDQLLLTFKLDIDFGIQIPIESSKSTSDIRFFLRMLS